MAVNLFEGSVTEPPRTFVTDLVADLCIKTRWLVTQPSLHTLDEQTGPVAAFFAAAWLALNGCNQAGAADALRTAL